MVSILASVAMGASPCPGDRRVLVVFPTVLAAAVAEMDPETASLVVKVADGLMAVDYPLPRFATRLVGSEPVITDKTMVTAAEVAVAELVDCAAIAVQPRLVALTHTAAGPQHQVAFEFALDVYERGSSGLVLADTFRASVPNLVDNVEDMMAAARRSTLDQIKQALPVSEKRLNQARDALDIAVSSLPAAQSAAAQSAVDQGGLALTRVASAAREPQLVPAVGDAVERPAQGLKWRSIENDCTLRPPKAEDPDASERNLQCAVLNRVRQAVREVQLDTRKRYRLGTEALADSGKILAPLGEGEGVAVGDGFRMVADGRNVGYARVRKVGVGGAAGWTEPSQLQRVLGGRLPERVSIEEDPRLGIEIGGMGGLMPAQRGPSELPLDPATGGVRTLPAGTFATAGTLRFDVHLGRPTGWYEWYQTNRIEVGFAGALSQKGAHFGLERRFLLAPRVYGLLGAAGGVSNFSVPAGVTKLSDDGEAVEISANANTFMGQAEAGFVFLLAPALSLRATAAGRLGPNVNTFKWSVDDLEGTVVLAAPIRTAGLVPGLSAAWMF